MVILLLILSALSAVAQPRQVNLYTATCSLSMSGSRVGCTIQQPASGSRIVQGVSAYIYCPVACTVDQERNGAAATGTSVTVRKAPEMDAATVTGWTASNVGNGTPLHEAGGIVIPAGGSMVLDLADVQMRGDGTSKNYSVFVTGASGTAKVLIAWREYAQ